MTTTTYDRIVQAAERLLSDDTKDTWGLADAVLAHVPEKPEGRPVGYSPEHGGVTVKQQLSLLVADMKLDGVITTKGEPYTAAALRHLRDAAVAWAKDERHVEASFSTHKEAAERKDGTKVLSALCAIARGESVARPRGFDLNAWNEAVQRIRTRKSGFQVAVDDIRIVFQKRQARYSPAKRKAMTLDEAIALIDSGDYTVEEVLDKLSKKTRATLLALLEKEARDERIRDDVAAGEEDMTDEELIDSDEELSRLSDSVSALTDSTKALEPGFVLHEVTRIDNIAGATLVVARKNGVPEDDQQDVLVKIDMAKHKLDLLAMQVRGGSFSVEDEKFLQGLGIA